MARLQGITGGLSGKLGSAVFRQRGGQTIAAQYQPIVKNPNSERQQEARAKFKLMSQLAAIMQDGFGTMGVNERPARGSLTPRNAFFKLNYGLVETVTETDGVSARIPMEQLKLTSSFRALPEVRAYYSGGEFSVSMRNIPNEVSAVRIIVVYYPNLPQSTISQPRIATMQTITPTEGNIESVSVIMPDSDSKTATVLAYGLIPQSNTARASLDDLFANEQLLPSTAQLKLTEMLTSGDIINTMTVGTNVTLTS